MTFRVIKGGGVFAFSSPWRQHHTRNGNVKAVYEDRETAEKKALELTQQLGFEITAYTCDDCSEWHLGNTRRYMNLWARELEELRLELGQRVAAHIKQETVKPYAAIRKRCITAIRQRMR